jgi:uncharacterized protein YdhG (YjbR/CyaY superfamily)
MVKSKPRGANTRPDTVTAYLTRVPKDARAALRNLRRDIRAAAPAAAETIAWGMPAFRQGKLLVGYAAFKDHCSFFPMSGSIISRYSAALRGYTTTKGSIHFTLEKPLPAALVRRIVRARIAETQSRQTIGGR